MILKIIPRVYYSVSIVSSRIESKNERMSARNSSKRTQSHNQTIPAVVVERKCKVCVDAGKSQAVYSSHWVKDNSGNVICPTLLSQNCRFCEKRGHTVKFCPRLKDGKPIVSVSSTTKPVIPSKALAKKAITSSGGAFESLCSDSEEEKEEEEEEEELFPALSVNITLRRHQKHFATTQEKPEQRGGARSNYATALIVGKVVVEDKPKEATKKPKVKVVYKNWADAESSDDEDSDDEDD